MDAEGEIEADLSFSVLLEIRAESGALDMLTLREMNKTLHDSPAHVPVPFCSSLTKPTSALFSLS